MAERRRVVITGLGVLAPNGCGKDAFWQACLQGRSGVRAITRFAASMLPTRIAGEIQDFSLQACGLTLQECSLLDRGTQLALAAANLALDDAGLTCTQLDGDARARIGVYLGTAMASVEVGERLWLQLTARGTHSPRACSYEDGPATLLQSYVPAGAIAAHHGLSGPCLTFTTGCSAGADAIGQAFWEIQEGRVERMLAGGSDSALSLLGLDVFCVMRALSTRNDQPERASRPYDAQRDGFVLSEGAAVLVLEERELALTRGAHIYAEIQTFVSNSNAYHMTALPEDGAPLQSLLRQLMLESNLLPEQLGYINSHGSSTPSNDPAETTAYKAVYGEYAYQIPISSTKSLIGHTQGAASAIEALVTALALDRQMLPPTINQETPDPRCDLDYIPNHARAIDPHHPLRFAITHSSGFGGVNAALLLSRHEANSEAETLITEAAKTTNTSFAPIFSSHDGTRRVVITGLGVIAPNGIGKAPFWEALRAGRSGIRSLTRGHNGDLSQQYAGEVRDFHVEDYLERKLGQRTDRMTHFALAAAQQALDDAGLTVEREDPRCIGVVLANALGGVEYVTQQMDNLYRRGPRAVSAYTAIAWLPVANVGQIALRYGLQGYCKVPASDLGGGLDALGQAYRAIRRGAADLLLAGGCEAPLQAGALRVLDAGLPLSSDAYRPFDRRAAGLLVAEGVGVCLLEEYEHARRRGARIYGEIVGYAQSCAPQNLFAPTAPDITICARALRLAVSESRLIPEDIACLYLDGRALPAWDAAEFAVLQHVFGPDVPFPCSVPRTQYGHSLAAAGACDAICALLALQERLIPPTINCEELDPRLAPAGLVRDQARVQDKHAHSALLCARGYGGSQSALVLRTL